MAETKANARALRSARNRRYNERRKAGLTQLGAADVRPASGFRVTDEVLAYARARVAQPQPVDIFRPSASAFPPGVAPAGLRIAQDDAIVATSSWAAGAYPQGFGPGVLSQGFIGYALLAELALIPEYRKISEVIATEMTRRWIRIQSTSDDDDKTDKIDAIEKALNKFKVRDLFRQAAEKDGFFGRHHLLVDMGTDQPDELRTPIGTGRDSASRVKIKPGSLKGFRSIEAVWTYPAAYDSSNPLAPNFYRPQAWYVQGKEIHHTRLLTFVAREVPDLLKPAYQFGGLSLSQIAKPYIDNWLRTRANVSDTVHRFSINGVEMDMAGAIANGAGADLMKRIQLMSLIRENHGFCAVNTGEKIFNVSTPLGTLDHLQAQAQEQMASIASIPLVKLLGITPSGLNASSDGEVRCFYDHIHSLQESFYGPRLDTVLDFIQLNEFGEIDEDITYSFEPLWTLDDKEQAEVDQIRAATDIQLVEGGILLEKEARQRIASDPESPYAGLVVDDIPDAPEPGEVLPEPPQPELGNRESEGDDPTEDASVIEAATKATEKAGEAAQAAQGTAERKRKEFGLG